MGFDDGSTFFGAIVRLSDATDLPDTGDLSSSDVLGTTLLTFQEPSAEVYGNLVVSLEPGWYAVTFGSGLFGAIGAGGVLRNGVDIGDPSYIARQSGAQWLDLSSFTTIRNQRFVVEGSIIPEPISLDLDIKPGSDENPVNLKSRGVLPMAVLSTDDFNVSDINVSTLLFGDPLLLSDGGMAAGPLHYAFEDISDDGLLDLTLKFSMRELVDYGALGPDTIEGLLTRIIHKQTGFCRNWFCEKELQLSCLKHRANEAEAQSRCFHGFPRLCFEFMNNPG